MSRRRILPIAAVLAAVAFSASPALAAPSAGITVNGSAQTTVSSDAAAKDLLAAYNGLFGPAIDDAHGKAALVAAKLGVTLGAVTAVEERSDSAYLGCGYAIADGGKGGPPVPVPPVAKPAGKPAKHGTHKKHKKPRKPRAKSRSVMMPVPGGVGTTTPPTYSCPVQLQVSVTYAIG